VRTGDRVGLWAPNRYEWLVIQYATARIGAILVTINPAYKAAELRYALTKTGVSLLVLARGFRQADYVAMVGEVRAECPLLREALVLEDAWEDLLADGHDVAEADLEAIEATLEPGDPINVQFTSGTTGAPKGATLSHRNILNNGYFTGRTLRYSEDDRVCVPVPFHHCFGMVVGNLACLTHGACLVVPGASFDPLATLRIVERERCTSLYGVPTMFIAQLEHPRSGDFNLFSLRTGIMAALPARSRS
jgi:fatty-acyl-CoA synthase